MKGICVAISDLTARLDATLGQLSSNQSKSAATAVPPPPPPPTVDSPDLEHHRRQVREEVREVQEQAKRRQSVIIRGLGASSPSGADSSFTALSEKMFGTGVELTDVVAIPNHQDLYRAKILNEEHRRLILTRAKSLKGTEYGQVYIRRDLTYKQRQEIRDRFAAANHNTARTPQVQERLHATMTAPQNLLPQEPALQGPSHPHQVGASVTTSAPGTNGAPTSTSALSTTHVPGTTGATDPLTDTPSSGGGNQ